MRLDFLFAVLLFDVPVEDIRAVQPAPELGIRTVVEVQLSGLKGHGRSGSDIAVELLFRFSAPEFRSRIGGERGIEAAMDGPLRPLASHREALFEPTQAKGNRASILVVTLDDTGKPDGFVFELQRTNGCWLIADIRPVAPSANGGRSAPRVRI